jgi:hypothetical protein
LAKRLNGKQHAPIIFLGERIGLSNTLDSRPRVKIQVGSAGKIKNPNKIFLSFVKSTIEEER